jgi:hypothetical protein
MITRSFLLAAILILLLLTSRHVYAQETGCLTGIVADTLGNPAAGVTVTALKNPHARVDTTDEFGRYFIDMLSAGIWKVNFRKRLFGIQPVQFASIVPPETTVFDFQLLPGCDYLVGDVNGNGAVNGVDVFYSIAYLRGGNPPARDCNPPCAHLSEPFFAAGDVNGDCAFNGVDVTFYIAFMKGIQPAWLRCPSCPPIDLAP